MIKQILTLLVLAVFAASAQNASLAEKDIPQKVLASLKKKASPLKHKDTAWSKNASGEFVASRAIGGNPAEDMPPEQTITARFHENGTWLETETVIGPYSAGVRKKLIPKNIFAACMKLVKKSGSEDLAGGVTIRDLPGKYTVEATCGDKRVTFDKKAKILKEE